LATSLSLNWQPDLSAGMGRRDRRGGPFRAYLPDLLANSPLVVGPELSAKAADAERAIHRLATMDGSRSLEGLSRFLLRSEAIASSMIEGIAPSPQQVALAELAQDEPIKGFSDQARIVANNITVLRRASKDLVETDAVTVEDVVRLHTELLPDERHHGLRTVQNWIGGSNWHPLEAAYVPPPADRVRPLMDDLVGYLNGSAHAPLVQAAVVHAQFETIHPFTDGNGRVGRSLIHTVLMRRRLTPAAMLPISLVLATLKDAYVDGLTAYRYDGAAHGSAARDGISRWLDGFMDTTLVSVDQAAQLVQEIAELRVDWTGRVAHYRTEHGRRQTPRANSATARILAMLPEAPVMTARTVERVLGVTFPAARTALEELADAGVLRRKTVERGTTGYLAKEVLDLVAYAERRLGSTRFDTRMAEPNRHVPAAPSAVAERGSSTDQHSASQ
jgi:Fic family protein